MSCIARFGVLGPMLLALAGCTSEAPPADLCRLSAPSERTLAGVFVGRPTAVPAFAILPLGGQAARKGGVGRLDFEGFTFNARPDEATGGLRAGKRNTAAPLTALTGKIEGVSAFDVAYTREDGAAWTGRVVTGAPTPDSLVATVGRTVFTGTALLTVLDLASTRAKPVEARGEVRLEVGFGSRQADLTVSNLRTTGGGSLPFKEIAWSGLSLCGARIGSTGAGGLELLMEAGVRAREAEAELAESAQSAVPQVAGPAAGQNGTEVTPATGSLPQDPLSPLTLPIGAPVEAAETTWGDGWGSAVFLGRFYGLTDSGWPKGAGGGFLIEGDSGLVSGLFVLSPGK